MSSDPTDATDVPLAFSPVSRSNPTPLHNPSPLSDNQSPSNALTPDSDTSDNSIEPNSTPQQRHLPRTPIAYVRNLITEFQQSLQEQLVQTEASFQSPYNPPATDPLPQTPLPSAITTKDFEMAESNLPQAHDSVLPESQTPSPARPSANTMNPGILATSPLPNQPLVETPPSLAPPPNLHNPTITQAQQPQTFASYYQYQANRQAIQPGQAIMTPHVPLATNLPNQISNHSPLIYNPNALGQVQPNYQAITWQDLVQTQRPTDVTVHELTQFSRLDTRRVSRVQLMHFIDRLHQMLTASAHIQDAIDESNALRNLTTNLDWKIMLTYTQAYVNPTENLGIPRSHFWRAMRQQHLRDVYTPPPEQLDLTTAIARMGENTRRTTNQIREMLENRSNQQRSSNFSQNRFPNRPFQSSSNNSFNFRSNNQNTNNFTAFIDTSKYI